MNFGIIAAGEGSRLAGEGVGVSKPLLPLLGQPMIGRLIKIFESFSPGSVCVVVNDFMPDVREYLERLAAELSVPLHIKVKSTPSSMHTFYELAHLFPDLGKFIATTVDTVFRPEDFKAYVKAYEELPSDEGGLMAVTDFIEDEKPLYVRVGDGMQIEAFEDRGFPGARFVSGGIYGLDGRAVEILDEAMDEGVSRMRNFQRMLLGRGLRLKAFPMGKIVDVDHASDIGRAEEFLRRG